jgi:hypothetical protein
MSFIRILACAIVLTLAACASVSTRIVQLDPAHRFPPTASVEVLLDEPDRPYVQIALLESEGSSEADLLNDAREKAKTLGADAIVRQEVERIYHPPMTVYDPWSDPWYDPYLGYRRWAPYPYYASPWGPYRVVGGGYTYVLKALAIKYKDEASG